MSFWVKLYRSCTDFSFYGEAAFFRPACAVRYLCGVLLLCSLAVAVHDGAAYGGGLTEYFRWAGWFFDGFRIENGQVQWTSRMPLTFDLGSTLVVLDGSARQQPPPAPKENRALFMELGKTSLTLTQASPLSTETRTLSLAPIRSFVFNPATAERMRNRTVAILFLLTLLFEFTGGLVGKLLQGFVFGTLVYWMLFPHRIRELPGPARLSLSLYALTPPLLLQTVSQLLLPDSRIAPILGAGMLCAFLLGAYLNNFRNPEAQ